MLEGSFPALLTPFNQRGDIDFGALSALIEYQLEKGIRQLFFLGTAGEVNSLTTKERTAVIEHANKQDKKGARFYVGCTQQTTEATIDMVRKAAGLGADGCMLGVPPYAALPVDDAVDYFMSVADVVDINLGIYNNAVRLKTNLTTGALLRIFTHERFKVLKESTFNPAQVTQTLVADHRINYFVDESQDPGLMLNALSLGAHGISNALGNVLPKQMDTLASPWKGSVDIEAFRLLFKQLYPLLCFTYSGTSPAPIKSLMRAIGLPGGYTRTPLKAVDVPRAVFQLANKLIK